MTRDRKSAMMQTCCIHACRMLACSPSLLAAERKPQLKIGSRKEQEAERRRKQKGAGSRKEQEAAKSRSGTACQHYNAMSPAARQIQREAEGSRRGKEKETADLESQSRTIPRWPAVMKRWRCSPASSCPYLPCNHTLLACLLPNTG